MAEFKISSSPEVIAHDQGRAMAELIEKIATWVLGDGTNAQCVALADGIRQEFAPKQAPGSVLLTFEGTRGTPTNEAAQRLTPTQAELERRTAAARAEAERVERERQALVRRQLNVLPIQATVLRQRSTAQVADEQVADYARRRRAAILSRDAARPSIVVQVGRGT